MKRLMIIIILSAFTFLSCSKDSSNIDDSNFEICYTFLDKETNLPIEGLGILMHIERNYGASPDLTIQGYTDENGNICKIVTSPLGGVTYFFVQNPTDQLYWSPFCPIVPSGIPIDYPSTTLYLSPTAYIRFHIESFNPENDEDYLSIQYNFLEVEAQHTFSCFDGTIHLNEILSDTIIIKPTRAGLNKIWWNKYINNNSINSGEQNINISTLDTLDVEIIHQ